MKPITKIKSVRLRPITVSKIKRIFNMNLREFIEITLSLSEENAYIKNKIKEKGIK